MATRVCCIIPSAFSLDREIRTFFLDEGARHSICVSVRYANNNK